MASTAKALKSTSTPAKPAKGLGKGLSALMSEGYSQSMAAEAGEGEGAARDTGPQTLPTYKLMAGPYQPRRQFAEEYLRELADSIAKNGVIQPILVRSSAISPGKYEIIAGERRWRASQIAGLESVPVILREMEDVQALELALIENIQRQDLNVLEEAAGYERLIEEFDYTQEQLAATVGKSRSHIANLLRLLDLPESIKTLLDNGLLTGGHARALLNAEHAEAIAERVWKEGLSVRETEQIVKAGQGAYLPTAPKPDTAQPTHSAAQSGAGDETAQTGASDIRDTAHAAHETASASRTAPRAEEKSEDILMLEDMLSTNLGLRVSITSYGAQAGEVMISYASLAQLDEILKRLGGSV